MNKAYGKLPVPAAPNKYISEKQAKIKQLENNIDIILLISVFLCGCVCSMQRLSYYCSTTVDYSINDTLGFTAFNNWNSE
jgi:hypothetical protein